MLNQAAHQNSHGLPDPSCTGAPPASLEYTLSHPPGTDMYDKKDRDKHAKLNSDKKKQQLHQIYNQFSARGGLEAQPSALSSPSKYSSKYSSNFSKKMKIAEEDVELPAGHPAPSTKLRASGRSNPAMLRTFQNASPRGAKPQVFEQLNLEQSIVIGLADIYKPENTTAAPGKHAKGTPKKKRAEKTRSKKDSKEKSLKRDQ